MEQKNIRTLYADEIECRAATVNEKGAALLLYKDARVDQRILDETFGPFGWKRSHQNINGSLYCTVEVRDPESGEWVAKQDVGIPGNSEREKSQASDSFKRACFNWGIGRELYSAPFIWIPAPLAQIQQKGDRYFYRERFSVASISYSSSREIAELQIAGSQGQTVFSWAGRQPCGLWGKSPGQKRPAAGLGAEKQEASISASQRASLMAELKRTGVTMGAVQERYHLDQPGRMSPDLYRKVMEALAKTKTKGNAAQAA